MRSRWTAGWSFGWYSHFQFFPSFSMYLALTSLSHRSLFFFALLSSFTLTLSFPLSHALDVPWFSLLDYCGRADTRPTAVTFSRFSVLLQWIRKQINTDLYFASFKGDAIQL